jgi:hypothetical protein
MSFGFWCVRPAESVFGGIVECAPASQPGDSGFQLHFRREFSGGAWITLHTEAVNQE